MKPFIYIVLLTLFLPLSLVAQSGQVEGVILAEEEMLSFATVAIEGTSLGVSTDEVGHFLLGAIPTGEHSLVFSALGYQTQKQVITVEETGTVQLGEINLKEDVLGLEEVVVTGTMRERMVSTSPIKVEVMNIKQLEKYIAPTNIVEGITMVNGVEEVVACGVCFTNSISINGLEGAYTAILMDGTPMYGNLASVYGLNGIPTMIIDRFEVIKGPSSTLYGSEAVAGVINIITKDPSKQPGLSVDIMGTSHRESFGSLAVAPKLGKLNGYIGVNYAYINDFEDFNLDGFGDGADLDRISLFTKWSTKRADGKQFSIAAKYYYEDRRNGVEAFLADRAYRDLRGDDQIYGESIYTNRWEVFGSYDLPTTELFRIDYSLSHHVQDSYYGADFYEAKQDIVFANLTWRKNLNRHDLLAGITTRYQTYDDNTIATQLETSNGLQNNPDEQFTPGVFVQDEWAMNPQLTLLAGMRLDHYQHHGLIFAPRLNLKYKTSDWTTLRANFGTGFRIVNLFTEDHAFVTGQRAVEIQETLKPEQSYNGALNFNHIYNLGTSQGVLDIDMNYTHFTNKITPNYDEPNKIIYANSDGYARTRGISANIQHSFAFPLGINLGVNTQKVTQTERLADGNSTTTPIEFAPEWTSVASANYNWKKHQLIFAYTMRATGPMTLPEVFDLDEMGNPLATARSTRSTPFSIHNLQLTKSFKKHHLAIYGGVQNIWNYKQAASPLVGFNDPNSSAGFSDHFDTAYAYSPIHGREFYLGVKWNTSK